MRRGIRSSAQSSRRWCRLTPESGHSARNHAGVSAGSQANGCERRRLRQDRKARSYGSSLDRHSRVPSRHSREGGNPARQGIIAAALPPTLSMSKDRRAQGRLPTPSPSRVREGSIGASAPPPACGRGSEACASARPELVWLRHSFASEGRRGARRSGVGTFGGEGGAGIHCGPPVVANGPGYLWHVGVGQRPLNSSFPRRREPSPPATASAVRH